MLHAKGTRDTRGDSPREHVEHVTSVVGEASFCAALRVIGVAPH